MGVKMSFCPPAMMLSAPTRSTLWTFVDPWRVCVRERKRKSVCVYVREKEGECVCGRTPL